MDISVLTKAGKKHWVIALAGLSIPHIIIWFVAIWIRDLIVDPILQNQSSIGTISSSMIISSFPVIYSVLREMKLLSSEIGRLALTTVIISDVVGICMIVLFEAMKQGEVKKIRALYYFLSVNGVSALVINGIPQVMQWINRQTPEGKPVEKSYIIATLLGVFVMGFTTDFIGAAIANGPLWLGLAIPHGPPMGATIVKKSEAIMNDILMPFAYLTIGLNTNIFAMTDCWPCITLIFVLVFITIFTKFVTVFMAAQFLDMSFKDSLTISCMLNLRGQTEFLLCLHWLDLKVRLRHRNICLYTHNYIIVFLIECLNITILFLLRRTKLF